MIKRIKVFRNTLDKEVSAIEINNKKYILKNIKTNNTNLISMLKNEANVLNKLKKTNVTPKLLDYKFDKNENKILIEFFPASPIALLKLDTFNGKIDLMIKIIEAVKKIHDLGIIHCDLTPGNILIDVKDEIKIVDFELAFNGTYFKDYYSINYCSKKYLQGLPADKTFDIYSLGVIFYEMIEGRLPYQMDEELTREQKLNGYFKKTLSPKLNNIFEKIFDENNEKYYKTLDEFENDLKLLKKVD